MGIVALFLLRICLCFSHFLKKLFEEYWDWTIKILKLRKKNYAKIKYIILHTYVCISAQELVSTAVYWLLYHLYVHNRLENESTIKMFAVFFTVRSKVLYLYHTSNYDFTVSYESVFYFFILCFYKNDLYFTIEKFSYGFRELKSR